MSVAGMSVFDMSDLGMSVLGMVAPASSAGVLEYAAGVLGGSSFLSLATGVPSRFSIFVVLGWTSAGLWRWNKPVTGLLGRAFVVAPGAGAMVSPAAVFAGMGLAVVQLVQLSGQQVVSQS